MTTLKFETSQIIENLEFFVNLVGVQQILDSIEPEYTDTKQFYNIVKDHVIFEDLCAICPKTFIKINGVEKFAQCFEKFEILPDFITENMMKNHQILLAYTNLCKRLNCGGNFDENYIQVSLSSIVKFSISIELAERIFEYWKTFDNCYVFRGSCYCIDENTAKLIIEQTIEKFAKDFQIYANFYNTLKFDTFSVRPIENSADNFRVRYIFTLFNGTVFQNWIQTPNQSKIDTTEKILEFYTNFNSMLV